MSSGLLAGLGFCIVSNRNGGAALNPARWLGGNRPKPGSALNPDGNGSAEYKKRFQLGVAPNLFALASARRRETLLSIN